MKRCGSLGWRQPQQVWLSPSLINGPAETCPATLEPHVSPRVHTGLALCSDGKWCQPLTAARPETDKDLLSSEARLKRTNADIDFWEGESGRRRKKTTHFGEETQSRAGGDMISLFGRWIIWSPLPEWTLKEVNCKYWFLKWTVNLTWRDYSYHLVERGPMNSKRWTKRGTCWISVSEHSKELYSLSNGCSISSDNSWDLIGAEKWNELWLHIQIAALVHAEIIREELLEEPSPLHYWSPLVGTKTSFLSHPEVKSEGQFDGALTRRGVLLLQLKGLVHPNHETKMFSLTLIVVSRHVYLVLFSQMLRFWPWRYMDFLSCSKQQNCEQFPLEEPFTEEIVPLLWSCCLSSIVLYCFECL